MFARSDIYFRLHLLLNTFHISCISLSLRRTSAPIHLTSVLGGLGTQETSCIVIAGLFERDSFDLLLPEIDKPWVIHLRETCCCSTNLCTWRPNTVYKNRHVRRHHLSWSRSSLCNSTCCVYWDTMNIEYYVKLICDLSSVCCLWSCMLSVASRYLGRVDASDSKREFLCLIVGSCL
jgi:hypothetical protein